MSYLKLMKLLYLSERESLRLYGTTISGDQLVSMPHGPVLSQTWDIMGSGSQNPQGWEYWVSDESNFEMSLTIDFERDDLDEINDATIEIMDSIYKQFGHMGRWEIRDYTHDHCGEWEDPQGSSRPIKIKDVFLAVEKSEDQAVRLEARYNSLQELEAITKSL